MRILLLFWFSVYITALTGLCQVPDAKASKVTLNGLTITIDRSTGNVTSLSSPFTGEFLQAKPPDAGIIDVAYPIDSFTPMRLASRFSSARLAEQVNGIVITWDSLGPSR